MNYKHIMTELAAATVEQIILERFGSKSMRIFRFIREKKYVEENHIQQVLIDLSKIVQLYYIVGWVEYHLYKDNKKSNVLLEIKSGFLSYYYLTLVCLMLMTDISK